MIIVPTRGMPQSVTTHNVDLHILCDWIEASNLFSTDELSQVDVIDRLLEEEVYENQDLAQEIVSDAWIELERRSRLCSNSYALEVTKDWVRRIETWDNKSAHTFCLLLSISATYDWWRKDFGHDYTIQGELFELLTDEALKALAPLWSTLRTGWSQSNPDCFKDIATKVSRIVGDGAPNLELWDTSKAKDMTLDILLYRSFPDNHQGFPYLMVQCASGANWEEKLSEPNLNVWRKIINPCTHPMRGFAVPFCLSDKTFYRSCVTTGGLLLDRCRLLSAGQYNNNWLPQEAYERINEWAKARIEGLLARSE